MPSIAIESYLVDDLAASVPVGFQHLRVTLAGGLPQEVALSDGWSVVLQVPTGVARTWLDSDAAAVVSASALERAAHRPTSDDDDDDDGAARNAPRLVARRGGGPLAAIPLAAGVSTLVRAGSALLEVVPLAWEIRAGAMRGGPGNATTLELGWRSQFSPGGPGSPAGE